MVHLAERGRRDRVFFKGRENLLDRSQFLGHPPRDLRKGRGRHLVLQLGKLLGVLLGQDVDAGGHELADLDQDAPHLDHVLAQDARVPGMERFHPGLSDLGRGKEVPDAEELVAQKHSEEQGHTLKESASVAK